MKTEEESLVSHLIVETFRLSGRLIAAGDALVRDLDLTSARLQVLGALAQSPVPLPVAHVARNMGLARQGVQRLANAMQADGLIVFSPNPHHVRAKVITLTEAGEGAYRQAMQRQRPWADALVAGLDSKDLATSLDTLVTLRRRLEIKQAAEEKSHAHDGNGPAHHDS